MILELTLKNLAQANCRVGQSRGVVSVLSRQLKASALNARFELIRIWSQKGATCSRPFSSLRDALDLRTAKGAVEERRHLLARNRSSRAIQQRWGSRATHRDAQCRQPVYERIELIGRRHVLESL